MTTETWWHGKSSMPPFHMNREEFELEKERPDAVKRGKQLVESCKRSAQDSLYQGDVVAAAKLLLDCRGEYVRLCHQNSDFDVVRQLAEEAFSYLTECGCAELAYTLQQEEEYNKDPYSLFYYNLGLAMITSKISDARTLKHVEIIKTDAIPHIQVEHRPLVTCKITKILRNYFFALGDYEKAEYHNRSFISLLMTSHRVKGLVNLSVDILQGFNDLQEILIAQGNIEEALDITEYEVEAQTSANREDCDFFHFLSNWALLLHQYGYDTEAENIWKRILNMYNEDFEKIKNIPLQDQDEFYSMIFMIMSFSRADLCCMYYNQNKIEETKKLRDEFLPHDNAPVRSRYFITLAAEVSTVMTSLDKYQYCMRIKVVSPKRMENVKSLRFSVINEGGTPVEEEEVEYKQGNRLVCWRSPLRALPEVGFYEFLVEPVFTDNTGRYVHAQRCAVDY